MLPSGRGFRLLLFGGRAHVGILPGGPRSDPSPMVAIRKNRRFQLKKMEISRIQSRLVGDLPEPSMDMNIENRNEVLEGPANVDSVISNL